MELRDIDFDRISRLVYHVCGINLHEGKKELVKSRLSRRLREGKFKSFSEYYQFIITRDGSDELEAMIDILSTNLTSFFREARHFQNLQDIVRSILLKNEGRNLPHSLRIWSAGCSSGEEPYSIAISVKEAIHEARMDVKILASDISTKALNTAEAGIYSEDRIKGIDPQVLKRYFQRGYGKWIGYYRLKSEIREIVQLLRLNLMDSFNLDCCFDVIFCRNVMIYFDKKTQEGLVNRLYDKLKKGGHLFVGHSESLMGLSHSFSFIEPSIYRK